MTARANIRSSKLNNKSKASMISAYSSDTVIKNSRVSFLVNYTITLFTVGFILLAAFVVIQAQEASSVTGTRRIPLVSGSVSTNDFKSKSAVPIKIQQRTSSAGDPVKQAFERKRAEADQRLSEQNVAVPSDNDEISSEQLTSSVAPASDVGTRQTRATTHKHSTSTTPGSDTEITTTIQPVISSSPTADNVSTEAESDGVERDRVRKKNKKKKQEIEEEEEEEEEEDERERARRKKFKLARKNNATFTLPDTSTTVSQSNGAAIRQPATIKQTPQVTTGLVSSSSDIEASSPLPKIATTVLKQRLSDSVTATSIEKQKTHHRHKHPAEDEDLEGTKPMTKRPMPDFSKVKLVVANHPIESLNKSNSTATSSMSTSLVPETSTTSKASTPPISSTSNPGWTSKHPSSDELYTLPTISKSTNETNSTQHGNLDSRSPLSQSTNLGKRLTTIIADTRNKLIKQSTSPPSTTASSRFAYSKPYSTTTMMTPLMQTEPVTESMWVQITNQSDPSQAIRFENATKHLDWSKLVKVVFKSSKDNQTVYTVVMNSSELSNHPINDWSNELPKLLKDDFEKLISKWSNVFPVDHLMTDLGKIIIDKVSVVPSNSTPINFVAKLNESLAVKPQDHPSNLATLVAHKSANKNVTIIPSTPNFHSSNHTQDNQSMIHFNPLNSTNPNSSNLTIPKSINDTLFNKNTTKPRYDIKTPNQEGSKSDTNSIATFSSPKPPDPVTTPWSSSSRDLGSFLSTGGQKQSAVPPKLQPERVNSTDFKNQLRNTTALQNSATNSTTLDDANKSNRSSIEIIKDMSEEHSKLENNLKEQGNSLRHFMVICSVAVVVATSLIVTLIVLLMR